MSNTTINLISEKATTKEIKDINLNLNIEISAMETNTIQYGKELRMIAKKIPEKHKNKASITILLTSIAYQIEKYKNG